MPERIVHETTTTLLATHVTWARSFPSRARGLIGRDLAPGSALVLEPASQIHTFGMSYAIEALFCDAGWAVLHVVRRLRPNRVTRWVSGSRRVVELPIGSIPSELVVGDRLVVS